jgi:hypothetical protein
MPTLTVDGLALDVVSTPSWSMGGFAHGGPVIPFIEAQVRVPPSVPTIRLDKSNAHVLLDLGAGRRVEGFGMWRAGRLSVESDLVWLRFEGAM